MKTRFWKLALTIAIISGDLSALSFAQAATLPPDTATVVNGVDAVCTGVGMTNRDNPKWNVYSVKVELAGKGGQFLGSAKISVLQSGNTLVTIDCAGPWALFKLKPGRYDVSATIGDQSRSGTVYSPQTGQGRVILRFLNMGGAITTSGQTSPSQ